MSNPQSIFVKKPEKGHRYAISDIHGYSKTFKKLLKKIGLKKTDQLFLVGDLINRGPKSKKVLEHVIKLRRRGYQVFFIRGNHEQMILNSSKKRPAQRKRQFRNLNSLSLLNNGELNSTYKRLLLDSYHFIETEDFFLVHAGFNHKAEEPFQDTYAMLNIREFKLKKKFFKNKSVVVGHTPKSISSIKKSTHERKVYIDNGCINYNTKGQGKLVCFNLDTREITRKKNSDI